MSPGSQFWSDEVGQRGILGVKRLTSMSLFTPICPSGMGEEPDRIPSATYNPTQFKTALG